MTRTRSIVRPSKAELQLIDRGRAAFDQLFTGQDFDSDVWTTKGTSVQGGKFGGAAVNWIASATFTSIPLSPTFARVVKSVVAIHYSNAGTMANVANAFGYLWAAIVRRRGDEPDVFSWAGLDAGDFEDAEMMLADAGLAPSTIYRQGVAWRSLLTRLHRAGIVRRIDPALVARRPESRDRFTLRGQEAHAERLISDDVIDALARIYSGEFELNELDGLLICFVAVMYATGLRYREVACLPVDAFCRHEGQAFVRYFRAKSKSRIEDRIALSPSQAELAEQAIDRALALTRDARARATDQCVSPDAFPVPPNWIAHGEVSAEEIGRLTGLAVPSVSARYKRHRLRRGGPRSPCFDVAGVRDAMQHGRTRESIVGVCQTASGHWLPLNRALFISFGRTATSASGLEFVDRVRIGCVSHATLLGFCSGSAGKASIFERLGLKGRGGTTLQLSPHDIRHYVTSRAATAGVADAHLIRWQRREHAGDLQAYKHLSVAERIARMKAALRSGQLQGEVAESYALLAPEDADAFLQTIVQAVHVTPLGLCLHDFSTAPCPKALNCVKGCSKFIFDPSDASQREELERLRSRNARTLQQALSSQRAGHALATAWVNEFEDTIAGIDRLLGKASPSARPLPLALVDRFLESS